MPRPEYRVRLFLSADLVGSTAFKAGSGQSIPSDELHPLWVKEVKEFYRSFPTRYQKIYKDSGASGDTLFSTYDIPQVWKTIGDEIILAVRVKNLNHLAYCVNSFIYSLDMYSVDLKKRAVKLDIKGCGWLAAFPSPNVTIFNVSNTIPVSELYDEEREREADLKPREHDYLGPEIDSGFRISRFSEANQFSMSAGLGLCLCDAAYHSLFRHQFVYNGRQILKGVANGNAYPVVTLDVERDSINREVRNYERAVTREYDVLPLHLANFLKSYMKREKLNIPTLKFNDEPIYEGDLPACYKDHVSKWEIESEVERRVDVLAASAAENEGEGNTENLDILQANADEVVDAADRPDARKIAEPQS